MLINIQGNKTYNPVTDQFLINVTLFLIIIGILSA